jgi:hypothetical protein
VLRMCTLADDGSVLLNMPCAPQHLTAILRLTKFTIQMGREGDYCRARRRESEPDLNRMQEEQTAAGAGVAARRCTTERTSGLSFKLKELRRR